MSLKDKVRAVLKKVKGSKAELNPFQEKAIDFVENHDGNLLIVGPTGIGKTFVAIASLIKYGRGFYLLPLRSLMREKYLELRKIFPNKNVVITNKDYSIPHHVIKNADIRVLSPYKFLIYLNVFEPNDGVVVVDEIHMINNDPEMEVSVSLMKTLGFKVIGLSATIREDDLIRMSRWLNAVVVSAKEERPVPLRFTEVKLDLVPKGVVVVKGCGYLRDGEKYVSKEHAVVDLVNAILTKDPDGGVLVWTPVRKESDYLAFLIAQTQKGVKVEEANNVVTANEHDRNLKFTLSRGIGVHHGGISQLNRELVEDLFMKKKVRVVTSCYTLSHGVNFPVRYLIITTLFDFSGKPLDPSTFHQISGRSGRYGLDKFGEVIVVTVGNLESFLLTSLLSEKAGKITSAIYNRWTVTKVVSQQLYLTKSLKSIVNFLKETYYVQQHGRVGLEELKKLAEEVVEDVVNAYFIVNGDKVVPKGRAEAIASSMGLHPKEWVIHKVMSEGRYREAVEEAIDACCEGISVSCDRDVVDKVVNYGFLSIYLGGYKTRELAEQVQTTLDALTLYVRRVYGWGSTEFKNARKISERFSYGGKESIMYLAQVLRHDEMKRVIRNIPQIVFAETLPPSEVIKMVSDVVRVVFDLKKVIYLRRVRKVTEAVLRTVVGEDIPKELKTNAVRAAYDVVKRIKVVTGARVK